MEHTEEYAPAGHEHAGHEHNSAGSSHVLEWPLYAGIYVLLMVLMGATVYAARLELGPLNNLLAMGIAVIKASLVVLFFMQVKFSSRLTWVWASIGFLWLVFLFGTLGDYLTRNWIQVIGWQ